MVKSQLLLTLFLLGFYPRLLPAQTKNLTSTFDQIVDPVLHPWIFLGLTAGKARVDTDFPFELDKQGTYLAAEAMVDFYYPDFALSGGGGLFYTKFPQQTKGQVVAESAAIRTSYILGSARYRLPKNFELGLISHILFGAANDFGPIEGAKHENYFMGPQLMYRIPGGNDLRFTLNILYDYTIDRRNVSIFTFGIQRGVQITEKLLNLD